MKESDKVALISFTLFIAFVGGLLIGAHIGSATWKNQALIHGHAGYVAVTNNSKYEMEFRWLPACRK
jgi:hypothetical protein